MARYKSSIFLFLAIFSGQFIGIPGAGLSKPQEITAYILIIAAFLWISEWVPLFLVSFLILALEIVWLNPYLNLGDESFLIGNFYTAFFSNIILLFLGGFILSAMMQKYGLDLKFAQAILNRTRGDSKLTLLGIILTCAFLSMWISNTATTAMMITIVFPLLKTIPKEHLFRTGLVLSIPFACNIGGIGTPIGTPPNAIALSYLHQKGFHLTFVEWMCITVPFMLIFLFILWRMLLLLFPAGTLTLSVENREDEKLTRTHYLAIAIFIMTAFGWFFSNQLGLATGTIALFPILASFWVGLLDVSDFRKLPWDILYIISGGIALGVALKASGLDNVFISLIPIETSYITIIILGAVITGAIATVMSNTAAAGLLIPLVISFDVQETKLLTLVLVITIMCSLAMALPVTTPPNAIAFSSRVIRTKDMIIVGGSITIIGLLCIIGLGPLYWNWLF